MKRPCGPGELFCLPCRAPRRPAGDIVDIVPVTATSGNMRGICPVCDRLIYRRVPFDRIELVAAGLEVTVSQAQGT